jgi:hypothetical protein
MITSSRFISLFLAMFARQGCDSLRSEFGSSDPACFRMRNEFRHHLLAALRLLSQNCSEPAIRWLDC